MSGKWATLRWAAVIGHASGNECYVGGNLSEVLAETLEKFAQGAARGDANHMLGHRVKSIKQSR